MILVECRNLVVCVLVLAPGGHDEGVVDGHADDLVHARPLQLTSSRYVALTIIQCSDDYASS